jgi:hypothetical protein
LKSRLIIAISSSTCVRIASMKVFCSIIAFFGLRTMGFSVLPPATTTYGNLVQPHFGQECASSAPLTFVLVAQASVLKRTTTALALFNPLTETTALNVHGPHASPAGLLRVAKASFVKRTVPTQTALCLFSPFKADSKASNDLASVLKEQKKYFDELKEREEKRDVEMKRRDAKMKKRDDELKKRDDELKKRDDEMKKFILKTSSSEAKKYAMHVEKQSNVKFDQQTKLINKRFEEQTKKYEEKRDVEMKRRDDELKKRDDELKKRDDEMKKFILKTSSSEAKKYAMHVEKQSNVKFDQQTKLIKKRFEEQTKKYDLQTKKYDQQTKLIISVRKHIQDLLKEYRKDFNKGLENLDYRLEALRKDLSTRLEDLRKELNNRIDGLLTVDR